MLYRFQLELSDIDRGVYESLDFRVAQHPSETGPYLLSRVLAYALSYQEDLEFSAAGLGDPEAPALQSAGVHGTVDLWIEIGNPSSRKLHKASKTAKKVVVYTYKSVSVLLDQMRSDEIHRAKDIEIYGFNSQFLADLEEHTEKNNQWSVLLQQGRLEIDIKGKVFATELVKTQLV